MTDRPRASGPVVMGMVWHDLLFAHWPVPLEVLRPRVPAGLQVDTIDGTAWLGVVPFRMTHVRPFRLPLPGGRFRVAEINVRTYVTGGGRRGVWFFSLDIDDRLSAAVGRIGYGLPYVHANVRSTADGDVTRFRSHRRSGKPADFEACYRPTGHPFNAERGSLDDFLTDRLSLFSSDRSGRLRRADVEHASWPLQPAEADIRRNTMAAFHGLALPDIAPRLLFARRLDVLGRAPAQPSS